MCIPPTASLICSLSLGRSGEVADVAVADDRRHPVSLSPVHSDSASRFSHSLVRLLPTTFIGFLSPSRSPPAPATPSPPPTATVGILAPVRSLHPTLFLSIVRSLPPMKPLPPPSVLGCLPSCLSPELPQVLELLFWVRPQPHTHLQLFDLATLDRKKHKSGRWFEVKTTTVI